MKKNSFSNIWMSPLVFLILIILVFFVLCLKIFQKIEDKKDLGFKNSDYKSSISMNHGDKYEK